MVRRFAPLIRSRMPETPGFLLPMTRDASRRERPCRTPEQAKTGIAALRVPKPDAHGGVDHATVAGDGIDPVMARPRKQGVLLRVTRADPDTSTGFALRRTTTGSIPEGPLRSVADRAARHAGSTCP